MGGSVAQAAGQRPLDEQRVSRALRLSNQLCSMVMQDDACGVYPHYRCSASEPVALQGAGEASLTRKRR